MGRKWTEIDSIRINEDTPFWTLFGRAKTVLEHKFFKYYPEMQLKEDEERALMHLVDVLRKDLEKNLEELQKAIFQTEVDLNILIAHSFLGPLTGDCILNDVHKSAVSKFKSSCNASCKNSQTLKTPSVVADLEGLCIGHGEAWYGQPDTTVSIPVVCSGGAASNNNEDSPGAGTPIGGKLDCKNVCHTFGQTVSTAITSSFV